LFLVNWLAVDKLS